MYISNMKKNIVIYFIFLTVSVSAQGYYPLEVGNKWEYSDCFSNEHLYTTKTVKDTIMPNGKKYTFLWSKKDTTTIYLQYFRQEENKVYAYSIYEEKEFLWYDFSKTTGDTVTIQYYGSDSSIVTVAYDRYVSVFGTMRRQWGFYEKSFMTSNYSLREVTDSIGLTFFTYESAPYDDCLTGAVISGKKYGDITEVEFFRESGINNFILFQNYPNPFNPTTTIKFSVKEQSIVKISITNILGQKITDLINEEKNTGMYEIQWNAENYSSGVYFYTLFINSKPVAIKKLMLIK
jgi:hypothetical protein